MKNNESIIREHLKSLSVEDIADSTYLFGVNFDTESLDSIFSKLITIYETVMTLKSMIDNNFQNEDGPKILMPSTPQTQSIIIRDYYSKRAVLEKILSNEVIYEEFERKLNIKNDNLGNGRPR